MLGQREPVAIGQTDVDQRRVGPTFLGSRQRLRDAAGEPDDGVTPGRDNSASEVTEGCIVIDDQDRVRH